MGGVINDNVSGGEFVYGETNNYLIASASMSAESHVRSVFLSGYGTAVDTATTTLSVPYPSNTAANDLILVLTGGKSETYRPWSTTFNRGVMTWNSFEDTDTYYQYYSDPIGPDAGRMNGCVFQRILTQGETGTADFTLPAPQTDYVHVGRSLRVTKSSTKEWNIQHYNCSYHYASGYSASPETGFMARTNPFLQTSATLKAAVSVGWDGKSTYVCGSSDGLIAYSNNGTVWNYSDTNPFTSSDNIRVIKYGANKFICTTGNGKIAWSTGGRIWTQITSPFTSATLIRLEYNGSCFIATSDTEIAKSYDGLSWTKKISNAIDTLTKPTFGDGIWLATETGDAATHYFVYSIDDGETWTRKSLGDNNTSIVYAKNISSNVYGTTPDGTPLWQWIGGYAFGYVSTNDPINGPFHYDIGDYQTPFTSYLSRSGQTGYFSTSDISSNGSSSYLVGGGGVSAIWRGRSIDGNNYASWANVVSEPVESDHNIEDHSSYGLNYAVYVKNDRWMYGAGTDGLFTYVSNTAYSYMDIEVDDLLIFQLVTPYAYSVSIYDVSLSGVVLSPITWIPTYSTTTGGNAAQYIGYAYVISGTPINGAKLRIQFYTNKNNDRSSTITVTRVRAEIIPEELISSSELSAEAVVFKNECVASASMLVDAFVEKAPVYVVNLGYAYNEVSGSSIGINSSSSLEAGTLIVLGFASDNYSGTQPTITVSDTIGTGSGDWVVHNYARQGTSSAGGVTVALAAKKLTVDTSGTYSITVTLSNAVKAKGISVSCYSNVLNVATTAVANSSSSVPSVSLSVSPINLVIGLIGWENETDYATAASGWTAIGNFTTGTGGNAATHIRQYSARRIASASDTYTFNPTFSNAYDWGAIIAEFKSGVQTGFISRATATLSATVELLEAKRATSSTVVSTYMDVTGECIPAAGEVVVGHIDSELTGTPSIGHNVTVTLDAVADAVGIASVPEIHNVTASLIGGNSLQAVSPIEATVMAMTATANTLLTPIIDEDTDPVIITNPPLPPGNETWGSDSGVEPTLGELPPDSGFGNIIEITNRTYSELYKTQRRYRSTSDRTAYQMQASQGKVAKLGGSDALCVHVQENSWYVDKFLDAPAMLVATVVDASSSYSPAVTSQRRYELPLSMRGFSASNSTIWELPDGDVIYTVTGMVHADISDLRDHTPIWHWSFENTLEEQINNRGSFSFNNTSWSYSNGWLSIQNSSTWAEWTPDNYAVWFTDSDQWNESTPAEIEQEIVVELSLGGLSNSNLYSNSELFMIGSSSGGSSYRGIIAVSGDPNPPYTSGNYLKFTDEGNFVGGFFVTNNYHHIKWTADFRTGRNRIYVDGELVSTVYLDIRNYDLDTVRYWAAPCFINLFGGNNNSVVYFNDIKVYGVEMEANWSNPPKYWSISNQSESTGTNFLDEGSLAYDGYGKPGPITIAARISVGDGGSIAYKWVKKWGVVGTFNPEEAHGGTWSGIFWGKLCPVGDNLVYQTISAYYVHFVKVDPSNGTWVEYSNAAETTGEFSIAISDGSNVALLHEDYGAGRTFYTTASLNPLYIDQISSDARTPNNITYSGGRQLVSSLYRLGSYPDSNVTIGWLGTTFTAKWSSLRSEAHLFVWSWDEDGRPYVSETYMADNVITDDLRGPGHGNLYTYYDTRWYENYSVAEDDTTPWIYVYGNSDTSSANWLTAVKTGATYSYVYLTNELGNQYSDPHRSMGVHCTYKLEQADDYGKAFAWYTPPVGNSTWDTYFRYAAQYPWSYSWYCNTHAQTLGNGNVFIFMTATNNYYTYTPLGTDWADQWDNGETRAFVCIVEGGDHPPLKLSQRDDDKIDGAARIGYTPLNGDSQRISPQAY